MEICVHAGLHKSGTTTTQHHFARRFGDGRKIWYPLLGRPHTGHHAPLIWPILGVDFDSAAPTPSLSDVVRIAEERGVEKLIISSEELDAIGPTHVEPLRTAFGDHRVRVVFTVTQPRHRWAAVWQEMVKHSLGAAPFTARELMYRSSCLGTGRLERLVTIFPADVTTVVLVRRDRPDPTLVASVAAALGLAWETDVDDAVLNRSIGEDIVLLAHLNSLGETSGFESRRSIERFERRRSANAGARIDRFAAWEFDLPPELAEAARAEAEFLRTGPGRLGVTLVDSAGLMDTWETDGPPEWYRTLAAGSVGPGGRLQTVAAIDASRRAAKERARTENQLDGDTSARNRFIDRLRTSIEHPAIVRTRRTWCPATALRRYARAVRGLLSARTNAPTHRRRRAGR